MKQEQIYQELVALLEKFDITVSEQNFKATNTKTRGGFCKVRNEKRFIIDKDLRLNRKIDLIVDFAMTLPLDDIYVVPVVRSLLKGEAYS
ncbi:MAG: hypothetical protein LJE94_12035 [Deltaproteobacteria bacterium]|nr:hypothetical protein [Deltaproteobacteria bacterium]